MAIQKVDRLLFYVLMPYCHSRINIYVIEYTISLR